MFTPRTLMAVILAGIAGTIANSLVVAGLVGAPLWGLILSFGRNAVAILVALLLPVIYARMHGIAAHAVAVVALAVIPSILAKTVFGVAAPWGLALAVNAVYAVSAVVVYLALTRSRAL